MDCSLVLPIVPPEDITLPDFTDKTFVNCHKTSKFMSFQVSCCTVVEKIGSDPLYRYALSETKHITHV